MSCTGTSTNPVLVLLLVLVLVLVSACVYSGSVLVLVLVLAHKGPSCETTIFCMYKSKSFIAKCAIFLEDCLVFNCLYKQLKRRFPDWDMINFCSFQLLAEMKQFCLT